MNHKTDETKEMIARLTRLETRMCRLMIALGVNPNRAENEPVNHMAPEPPTDYPQAAARKPTRPVFRLPFTNRGN